MHMTQAAAPPLLEAFETARQSGREAVDAGRFQEALTHFDEALRLAECSGDRARIDLSVCNRAAVLITLGEHHEVRAVLREILMRNTSLESAFLAAHNLSRSLELEKAFKKGLFYARVARGHAQALGHGGWQAAALNQIGNCLLGESYFDEAMATYQEALGAVDPTPSLVRCGLVGNLGYCAMMVGDFTRGFRLSIESLRTYRRLGAEAYQIAPHLDLCYGYLEVGRYRRADRHGQRGLALADRHGDRERRKNALFLLGETARAAGRAEAAHGYFQSLQREYYPDSPQIVDLMVAVEMRQMVNLRA